MGTWKFTIQQNQKLESMHSDLIDRLDSIGQCDFEMNNNANAMCWMSEFVTLVCSIWKILEISIPLSLPILGDMTTWMSC